jgi:type VI secretion system protein VasD
MNARGLAACGLGVLAALIVGTGAAFACSPSVPPPVQADSCTFQRVTATILASSDINRASNGEARPVQLRIYQLASDISLQNASFDDVWKNDTEALGKDVVKKEQFAVYPNTRTELAFERDDKANYVAAVALFRVPRGRSWYAVFDLPPAPSKGNCSQKACTGPNCDGGAAASPQIYIWIDESHVEDGVEHADFVPEGRVETRRSEAKAPPAPTQKAPTQ